MTLLRHSAILAIIGLCLLALISSSFASCIVTAEANCCADDHECDDPVCADGAICHCACAFSGVLTKLQVHTRIPTLSGMMNSAPVIAFVPQLSMDLFRPPRLA